jgi:hypothetical protein
VSDKPTLPRTCILTITKHVVSEKQHYTFLCVCVTIIISIIIIIIIIIITTIIVTIIVTI